MMELVNKLGKMINEFQQMNNDHVKQTIKEDLGKAIKEIVVALGPILPQLAVIAQESELRLGMRDNYLLNQLEPIATQYTALAKTFNIAQASTFPYQNQKDKLIMKVKGEVDQRLYILKREKDNLVKKNDYVRLPLNELLSMREQAKHINSPAGSVYQKFVGDCIKQSVGLHALERDIKSTEDDLFKLSQIPPIQQGRDHAGQMKAAISQLKNLYEMRDKLQVLIANNNISTEKIMNYEPDKAGAGKLLPGYQDIVFLII